MQDFEALGAGVCGVSVDGEERLGRFASRYRLPFGLLSDRGGTAAARYGSLTNLVLLKFARRNAFLIDPQGRIAKVYVSVDPSRNPQEILEDLRKFAAR